jgi:pyruvyl transferase EpsO
VVSTPAAVVGALRAQVDDVLREVLAGASRGALVDHPNHRNVGDCAIWLGERAALERAGLEVAYVSDLWSHSMAKLRRSLGPDGVILLHGGGNFGDVWPEHQAFRERIVREFPDHRIVQLPQTVHFDSSAAAERSGALLRAHGGLLVLARDERSQAILHDELGLAAVLCPDLALALELHGTEPPTTPVLRLRRSDHEASSSEDLPSIPTVDWIDQPTATRWTATRRRVAKRVRMTVSRAGRAAPTAFEAGVQRGLRSWLDALARREVDRGVRILSQGEVVITDRLHGHILCLLLGIPNVVLDNRYGKLHEFARTFTLDDPHVQLADSPQEALSLARRAVGRGP